MMPPEKKMKPLTNTTSITRTSTGAMTNGCHISESRKHTKK